MSIIGSNSKNTAGDLYAIDINLSISSPMNKRGKRLFDLAVCFGLMLSFPLVMIFSKRSGDFYSNWLVVLSGQKTWVGFVDNGQHIGNYSLPKIKKGVFTPLDGLTNQNINETTRSRMNLLYAKDYSASSDWNVLWKVLV